MADNSIRPRGYLFKDMTGQRFGRLTVLGDAGRDKDGKTLWLCLCDCGVEKTAVGKNLRMERTRSCGCLRRELTADTGRANTTHGMTYSPEYNSWHAMIRRCDPDNAEEFPYYGGRGISVCDRWRESFEAFYADMGPLPSPRHSIDRIDGNGDYEPGNCRWATAKEQQRNRRTNRMVEVGGEQMCLAEACERLGVNYSTVCKRIGRGWSDEQALKAKE